MLQHILPLQEKARFGIDVHTKRSIYHIANEQQSCPMGKNDIRISGLSIIQQNDAYKHQTDGPDIGRNPRITLVLQS